MSSKILPIKIQLKGDKEPKTHYALVLPDIKHPEDFICYRNALLEAVKSLLTDEGLSSYMSEELFWLVQLSEFITTSLDNLKK